jgi:AcrR family transcriptional regulator
MYSPLGEFNREVTGLSGQSVFPEKKPKNMRRRQPGHPGKEEADGAQMLLRAAQASFAQSGFKATSIREIAQAAGVHHALVIHRFGSKEELWLAVMDRIRTYLEPFIRDLRHLQEVRQATVQERVKEAFRILVAAISGEPDCALLLSRIASERGKAFDLLVEKLLRPFHDAFCPLLKEAMNAGTVAEQDPEMLYFMVFNAVIASISSCQILNYFDEHPRSLEKTQEDVAQFLALNILHPNIREA